ncbi:MAG: hypothetical protein ABIH01_00615, partial [Candidatus Omnitrophota bacterium]
YVFVDKNLTAPANEGPLESVELVSSKLHVPSGLGKDFSGVDMLIIQATKPVTFKDYEIKTLDNKLCVFFKGIKFPQKGKPTTKIALLAEHPPIKVAKKAPVAKKQVAAKKSSWGIAAKPSVAGKPSRPVKVKEQPYAVIKEVKVQEKPDGCLIEVVSDKGIDYYAFGSQVPTSRIIIDILDKKVFASDSLQLPQQLGPVQSVGLVRSKAPRPEALSADYHGVQALIIRLNREMQPPKDYNVLSSGNKLLVRIGAVQMPKGMKLASVLPKKERKTSKPLKPRPAKPLTGQWTETMGRVEIRGNRLRSYMHEGRKAFNKRVAIKICRQAARPLEHYG